MVSAARAHGLCLAGLVALFCLRVVAQPVAAAVELPWLPRFDDWHSGLLPYPALGAACCAEPLGASRAAAAC